MDYNFCTFSKQPFLKAALGMILLHHAFITAAESQDEPTTTTHMIVHPTHKEIEAPVSNEKSEKPPVFLSSDENLHNKALYTINFDNVVMTEYIRFVSSITKQNFIFNNEDLQFNVTIVSEDPVSSKDILSILIQVLRSHNLTVIEEDNSLFITNTRSVNQIATIVSEDSTQDSKHIAALVTRIFRIKNASLSTVATIIKPMMSAGALVEVSNETKQLIVTDTTTNVDRVSSLLVSLDTPHSSLEMGSYEAKHIEPNELIALATQLLTPFAEGNPVIFVPHEGTRTIFIVSSPHLIERALAICEDLDPSEGNESSKLQKVGYYTVKNRDVQDLLKSLQKAIKQLQEKGASASLLLTLKKAEQLEGSTTLLFLGREDDLVKAQDLIKTLDVPPQSNTLYNQIQIYKIQHISQQQLKEALDQIAISYSDTESTSEGLVPTIRSFKALNDGASVTFQGDPVSLKTLTEKILPLIDVASDEAGEFGQQEKSFIVSPKSIARDNLLKFLLEYASTLDLDQSKDKKLHTCIHSAVPIDRAQLVFRADPKTYAALLQIITQLDTPERLTNGDSSSFKIIPLAQGNAEQAKHQLENVLKTLIAQGGQEARSLSSLTIFNPDNKSLLLVGSQDTVAQAEALLLSYINSALDNPSLQRNNIRTYRPQYKSAEEIRTALTGFAEDFKKTGYQDTIGLIETLEKVHIVQGSIAYAATDTALKQNAVENLISQVDVLNPQEAQIQQIGEKTFLLYPVINSSPEQLLANLKGITSVAMQRRALDIQVAESLQNAQLVEGTHLLMFWGLPSVLKEVEIRVKQIDTPAFSNRSSDQSDKSILRFFFTPQQISLNRLEPILHELKPLYPDLLWEQKPALETMILFGHKKTLEEVEGVLKRLDTVSKNEAIGANGSNDPSFLIYKVQYHQGSELVAALKQIATDIGKGSNSAHQNLLNAANSLQWVSVTNSLIASGDGNSLSRLRELVQNLDVPLRQVFIEVLVLETSVTNTHNFGLQWGGKLQYLNKFAAGTGNFGVPSNSSAGNSSLSNAFSNSLSSINATTTPQASNIPFANGFDLGIIGDIIWHKGKSFLSLGSLVNALQLDNDSQVILNPKIITQDNRTSNIFVGHNVPFVGSQSQLSGGINQNITSSIEYKDIGVKLTITPTIGSNDVVTLDINNDISEVVDNNDNSFSNNSSITGIKSSRTTMTTRVHVPDQHFVVLSGMINESKTHYKTQIPCLGGLPIIGAAFSENDRTNTKQNVIIFVRPHIINTHEEYKALTGRQETLFKEQAVLPMIKEDIDAGIDMVKTPENE